MEISSLDLSGYDIVISSANYLAKFINVPDHTIHICYLHNPIRFLWKTKAYSKDSVPLGFISLPIIKTFLPILQKYDVQKTQKIDHLLVNSKNIANQVKNIYNRQATVIYPPVDINSYPLSDSQDDYYLYAGRLISHKRVDIAIQACMKLNRKLIIAGDGLERQNLEAFGGGNITFLGRTSDELMKQLYAHCKALLFPSDEDFGLVPVEVQACGRPVIAYRSGGALETVVENVTGVFFDEQTVDSMVDGIIRFESLKFDANNIRKNALNFDVSVFRSSFIEFINSIS
jgi:glycosyltransferase involved in cell wall biosynthesis